jgi:hypothetical protein
VDDERKVLLEFLVRMYAENRASGRHQEEQRSSVATMVVSVAAALLGLFAALWGERAELRIGLPIISILVSAVGFLGLVLTLKLFERSMVHFKISDGYLDAANALLEGAARRQFAVSPPPRYLVDIQRRLTGSEDTPRPEPFDIGFSNGRTKKVVVPPTEMQRRAEQHSPLFLGDIILPLHNDDARFPKIAGQSGIPFARLNLWTLWEVVYVTILLAGSCLTALTLTT